jgi:signal peptidase I
MFKAAGAAFIRNVNAPEFWSDVREKGSLFVRVACLVHVVRSYGVEATACVGPSMLPTFNARGDLLLQEYLSVFAELIRVGDVVVAYSPQNPRHVVCKRVLGLPGDEVAISRTASAAPRTVTVPEGHVWLQGDNTLNSTDSRHYGPVPYALLKGRAFCKVWPLWEAGWIDNRAPAPFGVR